MWAYESVFYQIYPLGFCGAPFENDGILEHRILKVNDWIPHIQKLGANAIYFSPVFESDTHGYNTRDYTKIDTRLGTNEDFKLVCDHLHKAGIKIIDSYRCESILYISCKPTSLARDILVFMNAGYKVKKIQCVDMFPNTVHVETVCLLSLK